MKFLKAILICFFAIFGLTSCENKSLCDCTDCYSIIFNQKRDNGDRPRIRALAVFKNGADITDSLTGRVETGPADTFRFLLGTGIFDIKMISTLGDSIKITGIDVSEDATCCSGPRTNHLDIVWEKEVDSTGYNKYVINKNEKYRECK